MKNLYTLLIAGLRLTFFCDVSFKNISFTPSLFWAISFCSFICSFIVDYFLINETPIRINSYGFQTEGCSIALVLLIGYLLSKVLRIPRIQWMFPSLAVSVGIFFYLISKLISYINNQVDVSYTWNHYVTFFVAYWLFIILYKIVSSMTFKFPRFGHLMVAPLLLLFVAIPLRFFQYSQLWTVDYYAQSQLKKAEEEPINTEELLFKQPKMLADTLGKMKEQRAGVPDLFFISFGSHGSQDVFMKEAQYTTQLFDQKFGTEGHSLSLINNKKTIDSQPLATVTNLKESLSSLAKKMDLEEDILFLYLTSHGSKSHKLSVSLEGMPLNKMPAEKLGGILKGSGIKWKVIVISACYSGGFIDHLKDEHTLVITASNKEKGSFGCSDESEMTWFGKAYFKEALAETNSFVEAFEKAKLLIDEWEVKENKTHSYPQIHSSPAIENKLAEWRAGLDEGSFIGK